MSFLNGIILKLGLSPENCVGGDIITLYDGKGLLVEGHKGVHLYSSEKIVVRLKKESLTVEGENLRIIEMNCSELFINGNITALARERNTGG